jgi:hypothetical protein
MRTLLCFFTLAQAATRAPAGARAAQWPKPMPARPAFEAHFNVQLPASVRVYHYYGEAGPMDPSFAWELGPLDPKVIQRCAKHVGLRRAVKSRPSEHTYTWPSWWNNAAIQKLPEVYFHEGAPGLIRIWVDGPHKRTWVEWVNL